MHFQGSNFPTYRYYKNNKNLKFELKVVTIKQLENVLINNYSNYINVDA